ncbi:tRNA uridine-5-carboxymethylaminomethyl(34) synthesis GTPase MnmE [Limimaricola hongkongensis]|uniref:tRNA modification GTPase MnmE n=1 Tax=Limimaricola hongkongensis DSM 17492 TaxID=1122180 RepID=A0A017HG96_9RHOB|nr:tRNA uridine-5-carboxymethylaminomethyl(34) synthesis GTPase MnmE [Limimaricola hongkongensis]EYD73163.1 GTPase and tRNA-U34 5-formylation enzyme TrmE [Limimaricola hongkongensis DSM 17492]
MDTIYALATARGRAGVAVIRISGPEARRAAERMAGALPAHGRGLRILRDGQGEVLDQALVLTFAEGRSFTGAAVVELHLHGSRAVINAVLARLSELEGLRLAEAGEFTRQALENGRLDLSQVEGLADLVDAETEAQRRQAMRTMAGGLGEKADLWKRDLLRAMALLEAVIDFAEEDVPVDVTPEVVEILDRCDAAMRREMDGVGVAERIREGFEVAIIGAPNMGKSTLLNHLAGRDAAIISDVPGTTRDVIEVRMELRGLPVTLLDTAGLRDSDDAVEAIGIARARSRAASADIRVHLVAPDDTVESVESGPDDIVRIARADMFDDARPGVSGRTGAGVSSLLDEISARLDQRSQGAGVAIRERHRLALRDGIDYIARCRLILPEGSAALDLAAEELRLAVRALDSLVGRVDVEDVLGEIFSSFCIGK